MGMCAFMLQRPLLPLKVPKRSIILESSGGNVFGTEGPNSSPCINKNQSKQTNETLPNHATMNIIKKGHTRASAFGPYWDSANNLGKGDDSVGDLK